MARPVSIPEEHLLSTARAVFMEKGLQATTAEVAARARVSEGILFKRYGSKAGLFRAAKNVGEEVARIEKMLASLEGKTAHERLEALAWGFLDVFRRIVPVVVMSISQGGPVPTPPPEMAGPVPAPLRTIRGVASFFASEAASGRMRARNPEVLARIFLGSIWHFVFMDVMVGSGGRPMSEDRFVAGLVETLLEGVQPAPCPPPSQRSRVRASRRTTVDPV